MALSMLGLRVRAFDGDEQAIESHHLPQLFETFDALVDAPLAPDALSVAGKTGDIMFLVEENATLWSAAEAAGVHASRIAVLSPTNSESRSWEQLCALLGVAEPVQPFPVGAPRSMRLFRDDRSGAECRPAPPLPGQACLLDDSPWILPFGSSWQPTPPTGQPQPSAGERLVHATMTEAPASFPPVVGTFPGNLASFAEEGVVHDHEGVRLVVTKSDAPGRSYRSGAFASVRPFAHGRFEVEIKAAPGAGLVTGFFLYRDTPRQEIDVEFSGGDPQCMLVNVYFNPGDDGTALSFGYRGSPYRIDLGFDTTLDFHRYAIDWRPSRITWSVDGRIVHERVGWDPTPLPHLPMRVHGNLWVPRSNELAGRIQDDALPASAIFKNLSVRS